MTPSPGRVGSASDPRLEILIEQAVRALDRQAARLDEHRARAASLFGAASIVGGFLGAEAFKLDSRPGPWAWLGALLFALTGVVLAYIMWPKSWRFDVDLAFTTEQMVKQDLTLDELTQKLVGAFDTYFRRNEPQLKCSANALAAMAVLIIGELVALFVDLAVG